MSPSPTSAKESVDATPPSPSTTYSSSSSDDDCLCTNRVIMCLLAAIPLVIAAVIGGLELATDVDSTAPGLDYGTGNMFDKIAPRYDAINRVLAMNMDIMWRRKMTRRIRELLSDDDSALPSPPSWKILDMATGTADVALQLVDDLAKSHPTTVLGLDPSENMLSVGRSKIEKRKLQSKIVLENADARDLRNYYARTNDESQKFHAATMAFGIRNVVPNRNKALCEIHKLLKPNGVLAILEFSNPSYETDGILGAAAGVFIRYIVPFVGGLLSAGAKQEYRHLQNSIQEFPAPDVFRQQLQDLECRLRDDDDDVYFYVGNFEMERVVHMNFGSVQLYVGRAVVHQKLSLTKADTKLPPIGA